MKVEELLQLLDERGLKDEEKVALLKEGLDALKPQDELMPEEEKANASKLLGVDF